MKYKGYSLLPESYEVELGFRPKIILRKDEGNSAHDEPLFWEKEFEDKNTADAFALINAKLYVGRKK